MAPLRDELPEVEKAQANIFDWEALRDYFGYVKNAILRHKLLALGTFVVTAALGLALAKFLPRSYYSEASLLPKRASTIAALVNPDRIPALDPDPPNPLRPPGEVDSVTRSAAQAVMRRENLVALIKRVNLLDRWDATRAPLLRLKDQVMHLISGRPTEDIKLDAMVGMLEKSLSVNTDDGKVAIGVIWPDPQLAYELVDAAQQSFLEARQKEELASITDALGILEEHEKVASENYKKAFLEFEKIFEQIMIERRRAVGDPRVGGFNTDQHLAELRFLIRAKRRAIGDSEEQHNRRLEGLNAELVAQKKLYGDNHPAIIELQQRIVGLRAQGSPQTKVLQGEEKELNAEYTRFGGGAVPFPDEPMPDPYGLERVLMGILPAVSENPKAAVSLDEVRARTIMMQQLRKRIDGAKLERDIAQASFKYRYTLLTPAEFPRTPVKPNAKVIAIGGIVAGLILGIFAALARDVLSGRFLQAWQVKRGLGLPVLAELEAQQPPMETQSQ
ncbi:chain-length determining protein [Vitiosangium sp. GDMCC 1.1324]|uniref:GumC family protein n=1 Tax=Vitiosangium sp. (strain GDMCC 1.1324) TaxID=2138576 RepID=UPI000D3DC103|nr:chain-length determining protein [Vitiosangium sp. GDMCC 1.1324]PTL75775.1 chain-length determining protein [Vitiosangium sp. GDMCC 1.1324]